MAPREDDVLVLEGPALRVVDVGDQRAGDEPRAGGLSGSEHRSVSPCVRVTPGPPQVDGEQLKRLRDRGDVRLADVAGNDTTRNTISGGTLALIENRDQRQKLLDDPSLLEGAIEEMLRWVTPVMWFKRTPQADTEIRGIPIKEGDKVVLWYASGSRDEEAVSDPMSFRVDGGRVPPGIRRRWSALLLGSPLARLELTLLFPELLRRLPDMELAGPVARTRSEWVNGITSLPVSFTATPVGSR